MSSSLPVVAICCLARSIEEPNLGDETLNLKLMYMLNPSLEIAQLRLTPSMVITIDLTVLPGDKRCSVSSLLSPSNGFVGE